MKNHTLIVYHPGMKTSMALSECIVFPVPDEIVAAGSEFIDSWIDMRIEGMENDHAQGIHENFLAGA